MNNTGEEILEILTPSGKSAPEITHVLKFIGNGSMEAGLSKIGDYFQKEVKNGTMKGAIGGVIGGVILMKTVELVKKKIDESKNHKEEGEVILKGLREGLNDFSKEDNILCDDRLSECEGKE